MIKILKIMLMCVFVFKMAVNSYARDFYVDYSGGNDSNLGVSQTNSWQHCPGDPKALNIPLTTRLLPGDNIYFKSGVVYRGQIRITASGTLTAPINFLGSAWGSDKAIIDGSEYLSGWRKCESQTVCGNNPNWRSIYYTKILESSAFKLNLHEYDNLTNTDNFLAISQTPNQPDSFFMDSIANFIPVAPTNMSITTIRDVTIFNQLDANYWNGSSILIWVNPNTVLNKRITSFNPTTNTITFETLASNAIYGDRNQFYSLYNSINALDLPGEYYLNPIADVNGLYTLYLMPRNPCTIDENISYSIRNYGFDLYGCSFVTIDGFIVRKFVGEGARQGTAIGSIGYTYSDKQGIIIKNNIITHNRYSGAGSTAMGYGGIYLETVRNSIIENNYIIENSKHRGIFVDKNTNVIIKNNIITRAGGTSLGIYRSKNLQILNNIINESEGMHSNGLTIYIGSRDILIANNKILKSHSPVTFQDSGNLFFINNIFDGNNEDNNMNEWSNTPGGTIERGIIAIFNNSFLRNRRNLAIGVRTDTGNTYIVKNNFIDGGANNVTDRSNNCYTGLLWNQATRYGWALGLNEFIQENLSLLFIDPLNLNFHLIYGSQGIDKGVDINSYLNEAKTLFPDFNFNLDMDGNVRPKGTTWDIGPYEYTN